MAPGKSKDAALIAYRAIVSTLPFTSTSSRGKAFVENRVVSIGFSVVFFSASVFRHQGIQGKRRDRLSNIRVLPTIH
ncbi:MAG: hypothetical protein HQK94_18050 [Nitrospirae bacterium]|nr:hypothetical protein [Nitrospirota bacterium]